MTTSAPSAPPSPSATVLALREAGSGLPAVHRDLAVLAAAYPQDDQEALGRLPIGQRDARLVDVYESLFGSRLDAALDCGACGERLELRLDTRDLRAGSHPDPLPRNGSPRRADTERADTWSTLDLAGFQVEYRSPDSTDLAVAAMADPVTARAQLAARLLRIHRDAEPVPIDRAPAEVLATAVEALSRLDPQAETSVRTPCPTCGAACEAMLNVGSLLWARIDAAAAALIREVDALARAYGWSEGEILALGLDRRQAYLELVR